MKPQREFAMPKRNAEKERKALDVNSESPGLDIVDEPEPAKASDRQGIRPQPDAPLLDESGFNLVSLVEESPVGVFQTTPEGRFRYANRGLAELLGYNSQKELIDTIQNLALDLLADPKQRDLVIKLLRDGDRVRRFEYQIVRKDKSTRWVSFSARRVKAGEEEFFEGFMEDITEMKKVIEDLEKKKAELEAEQRRVEGLLKNMPGMTYRCARQHPWKMYYVSEGAERLTGYTPQDFLDDKPTYGSIIDGKEWQNKVEDTIAEAIQRNTSFTLVYPIKTLDDELKWVFERGKATKDAGGNDVLEGFITNYTELKVENDARTEERNRARAELKRKEAEIEKIQYDTKLRRVIAWALIGIFVFTTLVVLGLVTFTALKTGLDQGTLLGMFGGLVAELTGIVVLVARYLFPRAASGIVNEDET